MIASMPAHFSVGRTGAVGFVLPGMEVEIVDDADMPLLAGQEGVVRIRSPYGATEYLEDPDESARVFLDGWFYPGDLGRLTADNMLVITGRETNVVNIGGEKVNPEKLEEILLDHPDVMQAAIIAMPNELGVNDICALLVPRCIPQRGFAPRILPSPDATRDDSGSVFCGLPIAYR